MAGLDNIIRQIGAEAEDTAAALKTEAQGKAAGILEEARAKAAAVLEKADADNAAEAEKTVARFRSQADTMKKQSFLAAKQEMIAGCIAKAKEQVLAQDKTSYFAMIEKLIGQHLGAKDGVLYLSRQDQARLPEGFFGKVAALAKEKGGSLRLADQPAEIDGGFVLDYGGIEENCSISAIFEEHADELADTVGKLLFS